MNVTLWLKDWNGSPPAWLQIEFTTTRPYSLLALLCASLPTTVNDMKGDVIMSQSLHIIRQFKKCLGIQNISIYSPIINSHHGYILHEKSKVFQENTVASFEQLSVKHIKYSFIFLSTN